MKKILSIVMLSMAFLSFSQNDASAVEPAVEYVAPVETSLKEYLYFTKGYKTDLEQGKDILQGYTLEPGLSKRIENYNFNFQYVYDSTKTLKAVSVQIKSNLTNNNYFLCIPINNEGLLDEHYKQIKTFGLPLIQAYSLALVENYSSSIINYVDLLKTVQKQP